MGILQQIGIFALCYVGGLVCGSIMTNRGWRKKIKDFTKEMELQLDKNKKTQAALSKVIEKKEEELKYQLNNRDQYYTLKKSRR